MYKDLIAKDKQLYTQNGLLHMLERNKRIKEKPERFQDCKEEFDVIFTVEERVFDQVVEGLFEIFLQPNVPKMFWIFVSTKKKDLESREKNTNQPIHVINIDVCDNHEDATLGAFILLDLAQMVIFVCHTGTIMPFWNHFPFTLSCKTVKIWKMKSMRFCRTLNQKYNELYYTQFRFIDSMA